MGTRKTSHIQNGRKQYSRVNVLIVKERFEYKVTLTIK